MNAKTFTLSLLVASLLASALVPVASAGHSLCHNEPFPGDVNVEAAGFSVGVDTGYGGATGAYVVCVNSVGYVVYVLAAPTGTGVVTMIKVCQGNSGTACTTLLGTTGASVGPQDPAYTSLACAVNTCVYVWVNGSTLP